MDDLEKYIYVEGDLCLMLALLCIKLTTRYKQRRREKLEDLNQEEEGIGGNGIG